METMWPLDELSLAGGSKGQDRLGNEGQGASSPVRGLEPLAWGHIK